ncbi:MULTISPECIES: helix-turn-helix domain-containing protein [Nonomuraea]|uniref:Helix-turn-helix domain-containing protein n=1 Tax=Nonomuraea mangrovi TaxID=2316207 RepID=A0ABW4SMP5_9ACTN
MTSDLGRRVRYHRERLGLTTDEVAERAKLAPGYLRLLEEQVAAPGMETLLRLADALGTTARDLLGERFDQPQGGAPPSAAPRLETLSREECIRLIAPGGVGRVAFDGLRGPTVVPVNYRMDEGTIVFRTAYGGPMDEDLRTGIEGVERKVGFEVDRIDEATREGWSVLVQGPAHHDTTGPDVRPWAGGDRTLYVRIVPTQITGRRIVAS